MAKREPGGREPSRDERGVVFPIGDDGSRSTTVTGKAVLADAARTVDEELAAAIEAERDWRKHYHLHVLRLVEGGARSAEGATAVASAGLESAHGRFAFVRDGADAPLTKVLAAPPEPAVDLETVTVAGMGEREDALSLPFRGDRLRGDDLHSQLDRWQQAGIVEPSFVEAIRLVMANPDWLELSDRSVVLLGAGAEMGPLHSLGRWGATVVPVDLPRPDLWARVLETVRRGSGRALVPVRGPAKADGDDDALAQVAGANLILELPEVASWLSGLDGPLTIGNYVYADGGTFVRAAMAVDAITSHLADTRPDTAIAVLATPTDVFAVPDEAVDMARERLQGTRIRGAVRAVTRSRLFRPNYEDDVTSVEGVRFGIADCMVPQQGPNYALAKRLAQWRASVARDQGIVSSINVAPPTRTRSVLKNRALAAAYAGARRFGVEVFEPATSNTLMAAMLVHDLRNPKAAAHPTTTLRHPYELFGYGANHGGLWRSPFAARSVLGLAAAIGIFQRRS